MFLVVRSTPNPAGDAERGWSAWNGYYASSGIGILDTIEDLRIPDEDDQDFLARMIDEGIIREFAGRYAVVHHDGLSSYLLGDDEEIAERLADAPEDPEIDAAFERQLPGIDGYAGGVVAIDAEYIRPLRSNWHLFRCREVGSQMDS